jgi:hypothetical protein
LNFSQFALHFALFVSDFQIPTILVVGVALHVLVEQHLPVLLGAGYKVVVLNIIFFCQPGFQLACKKFYLLEV